MSNPGSPPAPAFPNFTEMPRLLPGWAWRLLRALSVIGALAMAALLVLEPDLGLPLFWGLVVPVLPLVFMFTPGLWRNLCPLATSNQLPRRLGLSQGWTGQSLSQGKAYPLGITLLLAGVIGRKLLFNFNGVATAALILGAMGAALIGGLLYKGKSGWCSSVCPLLPVQRLYGQTPFIRIANTQCEPCVGCAKNCYDFNPGVAWLADQYDPNPAYRNFRRFFASIFPGLILGYYLVPGVEEIGPLSVLLHMAMFLAGSLSVFTLAELVIGTTTRNALPVLWAALAINLYYWFAAPMVAQVLQRLGVHPDLTLVGAVRTAVAIGSLIWVGRSLQVERLFLGEQLRRSQAGESALAPVVVETVRLNRKHIPILPVVTDEAAAATPPAPAAATASDAAPSSAPSGAEVGAGPAQLLVQPGDLTAALKSGRSLLELLEGCGANIHPGCRAGVCGADAIAVTQGAGCLGPIGDTERATLARLGHASNTRLACMAKVKRPGTVKVDLQPHAPGQEDASGLQSQPVPLTVPADLPVLHDALPITRPTPKAIGLRTAVPDALAAIRRVVIVGNGVAGLSAAEELRRHHPGCEIQVIAGERYPAYNRMMISSLIGSRRGLQGLWLKPDAWYAEQRIDAWLNTRAVALDTTAHQLRLATGEKLGYDRLILATGAGAWVPPVAGYGTLGCFVLRHANDAMGLRAYVQRHRVRRAVVVGAGLLGVEAAHALRELHLQVQLLSLSDRVLDRQADATASALVVQQLARLGIEFLPNASLRAVEPGEHGRLQHLRLEDGRSLPAELMLMCAGTRPELGLARAAGLDIQRGIRVDRRMRTSAPDVFAAGDVAECEGELYGLWGVAAEQGRIAALSALGLSGEYRSAVPVTVLKLPGIQMRSAGLAEPKAPGQSAHVLPPAPPEPGEDAGGSPVQAQGPQHSQLVIEAGRVVGAVVVGDDPQGDDWLAAASSHQAVAQLQPLLRLRGGLPPPAGVLAPATPEGGTHRAASPRVASVGRAPVDRARRVA
jgi:NADPH-dependent 2,4-dienoyl-CoA reductase/sulfur reductase-like enzyme/ferredoxin